MQAEPPGSSDPDEDTEARLLRRQKDRLSRAKINVPASLDLASVPETIAVFTTNGVVAGTLYLRELLMQKGRIAPNCVDVGGVRMKPTQVSVNHSHFPTHVFGCDLSAVEHDTLCLPTGAWDVYSRERGRTKACHACTKLAGPCIQPSLPSISPGFCAKVRVVAAQPSPL